MSAAPKSSSKKSKTSIAITDIQYPYEKTWDKTKTNVRFVINNSNVSMMNAIRRTMISDVPTFGFKTEPYEKSMVEVIKNDSPLHNEFISHRIGMIPINILDTDFKIEDYEFIIDEKNNTNFPKKITSGHFKILKISTNEFLPREEVEKIFPKDPLTNEDILITELKPCYNVIDYKLNSYKDELMRSFGKEQYFHIKAKAVLSTGSENSRFSPITATSYQYKIDEERAKQGETDFILKEIKKAQDKGLKPKDEEALSRYFKTTLIERFYHIDENEEPYIFNFNIESLGYLPPLIVLHRGIQVLIEKINKFMINLKSYNDNIIQIATSPNLENGYQLTIQDENDTLGNLLQEHFYDLFCEDEDNMILNYIGYKKIHPLEEKIVINIQPVKKMNWEEIINSIFVIGTKHIISKLTKLQNNLESKKEFIKELKSI